MLVSEGTVSDGVSEGVCKKAVEGAEPSEAIAELDEGHSGMEGRVGAKEEAEAEVGAEAEAGLRLRLKLVFVRTALALAGGVRRG